MLVRQNRTEKYPYYTLELPDEPAIYDSKTFEISEELWERYREAAKLWAVVQLDLSLQWRHGREINGKEDQEHGSGGK